MHVTRFLFFIISLSHVLCLFSQGALPSTEQTSFVLQVEPFAYACLDYSSDYFPLLLDSLKNFPFQNYTISKDAGPGCFLIDKKSEFYQGDLIKNIVEIGGVWEPFILVHLWDYARPGSTIVNIGAHIGTHIKIMADCVGPNGCVYAFEPQPKIFKELFMNLLLNQVSNVKLYPIALGNEESSIELRPLALGNEAGTGLGGITTGQFVPLKSLDSFHLQNVSIIKIDVEGMEYQVLEGAKNTILNNKPIILIEIEGGSCHETASDCIKNKINRAISLLESYGYIVQRSDQLTKGQWAACWDYVGFPRN